MLRIYCLQQWVNLSAPAAEEALYDSLSMRQFVGIDLGREPVPDETTICVSGTFWSSTILAGGCLNASTYTWSAKAYGFPVVRLWTRRLSTRRVRPRTRRKHVTRTCARPRRATNGTLA